MVNLAESVKASYAKMKAKKMGIPQKSKTGPAMNSKRQALMSAFLKGKKK